MFESILFASPSTGRARSAFLVAAIVLNATVCSITSADDRLSPDQPYGGELSNAVEYEVEFSAIVTPPYHAKLLEVWLPIPPSDSIQKVSGSELSSYPMELEPQIGTEPMYGNRFAYFAFNEPRGAQIVRHRFTVRVHEVRWQIDPARLQSVDSWPESFDPYLRSVADVVGASAYRKILSRIDAPEGAPSLFAAMDWIDQNLTYDHVEASLRGSADWAFSRRRGHCSDYHGLCQTFGRSLGTPTRVTYGINLFPKNSPSHCKIEAYLTPYGWVSFDLSETQKLVRKIAANGSLSDAEKRTLADAARRRLRSGFRDNTWMLWTRGTNYELAPRASGPVAVVRTIYAEADGEPLPDPDPANIELRRFGWMTAHKYTPNREVTYPFKDLTSLEGWKASTQADRSSDRSDP